MGANRQPQHPSAPDAGRAHHASGLTSRLILAYVERHKGTGAVDAVLELCDLADREAELHDDTVWFDFGLKIQLFEAAATVLGDRDAARHIGGAAIDLDVAAGLKLALRTFGSPRLAYANVARTAGRFTSTHRLDLVEVSATHASFRYADVAGVGYHRTDCQYNIGLFSCVPTLFGHRPAQVEHSTCALNGADACVYDVRWDHERAGVERTAALWAGSSATALGLGAVVPSAPLLGVAVAAALAGAVFARRALRARGQRRRSLELELRDQKEGAERLSASLRDLVSDLRLDEVLEKVINNAQAAVVGKEFALLVHADGGLHCRRSSRIPPESLAALEDWATATPELFEAALMYADLATVPQLATLPADPVTPLGGVYAVPLIFKHDRLGVLLALAHGVDAFLPSEIEMLEAYADQAAIALANAHLVERLGTLASQDPLTGLLNHREFHERLEREIDRGRRYDQRLSVALYDLDGFKQVNDRSGHAFGDRVLRDVATVLSAACRSSDLAFRTGGDEFALLLPGAGADEALLIAERVRAAVEALDSEVGVSFGIAEWPDAAAGKDELLLRADMALYAAKPRSRGHRLGALTKRPQREPSSAVTGARGLDDRDDTTQRYLAAARLYVGMDAAYVVELCEGDEVWRRREPTSGPVAPAEGARIAVKDGYCGRTVDGSLPRLIPDTRQDARTLDSPLTREGDIGSYIGVPLRLSDGRIYGVLSCLSRAASPWLGQRDVDFMQTLADLLVSDLEHRELEEQERRRQVEETGLDALLAAIGERDRYTAEHTNAVVELSTTVAARLGLSDPAVEEVRKVAFLHDIGKLGMPDSILQKEGRLDEAEWDMMRTHPEVGARMTACIPGLVYLGPAVRAEHERWDGGGYPDGLAGDEIPLASRIVAVCDAYHAMTSDRPYRVAKSAEFALKELQAHAGGQFDPSVVKEITELLQRAPREERVSPLGEQPARR